MRLKFRRSLGTTYIAAVADALKRKEEEEDIMHNVQMAVKGILTITATAPRRRKSHG